TPRAERLRLFKSLPRCLRTSLATTQRPKSRSRRTVALCIAPIAGTTAWPCTPPTRETDYLPRLDGSSRKVASHASLVSTRQGAFSVQPTSRATRLSRFECTLTLGCSPPQAKWSRMRAQLPSCSLGGHSCWLGRAEKLSLAILEGRWGGGSSSRCRAAGCWPTVPCSLPRPWPKALAVEPSAPQCPPPAPRWRWPRRAGKSTLSAGSRRARTRSVRSGLG